MLATTSFDSIKGTNAHFEAAKQQIAVLSHKIHSAFTQMSQQVETSVKPVFQAVAYPIRHFTDKLARMGKAGQSPWAQVGMAYDANNGAKKRATKNWAIQRLNQLRQSTKFVYS